MILNEIFKAEDLKENTQEVIDELNSCRQYILDNWNDYIKIGDARCSDEKSSNKLVMIFSRFGRTASTNSIYQMVVRSDGQFLVRIANHEAEMKNFQNQITEIPSIATIYDFRFLDQPDKVLPPKEIITNIDSGMVKTLHIIVIINRKHLNPRVDVIAFIDSLIQLVDTKKYTHPFISISESQIRTTVHLTESELRHIISSILRTTSRHTKQGVVNEIMDRLNGKKQIKETFGQRRRRLREYENNQDIY